MFGEQRIHWSYALVAFALCAALGCAGGGGSGGAALAPTLPTGTLQLDSVLPADGASNVSMSASVEALFLEPVDASTVKPSSFLLFQGGNQLACSVSATPDGKRAQLVPTNPLTPGTIYRATLTTTIRSLAGNALDHDLSWTFSTLNMTGPSVSLITPLAGTQTVPVLAQVVVKFSKPIDESTVTRATFRLEGPSGALPATLTTTATLATLTPDAPLAIDTNYSIKVTKGIRDLQGHALTNPSTWAIRTIELVPPAVTAVLPANNAAGVSLSPVVQARFSEDLDANTINYLSFFLTETGDPLQTPIAAQVAYDSGTDTATMSLPNPLVSLTNYTITIKGSIQDPSGNPIGADVVTNFTVADYEVPYATNYFPVDGASGVSVDTQIRVDFSKDMDPATMNSASMILWDNFNQTVPCQISYSSATRTATMTPNLPLQPNANHAVELTAAVRDMSGIALGPPYGSGFTTGAIVPPVVIQTIPDNLSSNIDTGVAIQAIFTKKLAASTINASSFLLYKGLAPNLTLIPAVTITYDDVTGPPTATLIPAVPLEELTDYTLTVTTAVQSLSQANLVADKVWTFRTKSNTTGPAMLGNPMLLETNDGRSASAPRVDIDADDAIAVWKQAPPPPALNRTNIYASIQAAGAWTAPVELDMDPDDASAPQVAVDAARGHAWAVWVQSVGTNANSSSICAKHGSKASGSWQWDNSVVVISSSVDEGNNEGGRSPKIRVDRATGKFFVVYLQTWGGTTNNKDNTVDAFATDWSPAANSWSSPVQLDDEPNLGDITDITLDVDSGTGTAYAAWQQKRKIVGAPGYTKYNVYLSASAPGSGWLDRTPALAESDDSNNAELPSMSVDAASGDAFVTWLQRIPPSAKKTVFAGRYRFNSGQWISSAPVALESDDSSDPGAPQIAVNQAGTVLAIWAQTIDAPNGDGRSSIYSRVFDANSGQWNATGPVLAENDAVNQASEPQVAGFGQEFYGAWLQETAPNTLTMFSKKFSLANGWDPLARPLEGTASSASEDSETPALASNGSSRCALGWLRSSNISGVGYLKSAWGSVFP